MRRALLLIALTTALIWLMKATPAEVKVKAEFRAAESSSGSLAPSLAPSAPVQDPCGGCDPNEEYNCINSGGSWDPNSCTCTYGCDPNQEQECYFNGGTWDGYPWCSCTYWECNPGSPQVVGEYTESYEYCDGWEYWYCDGTWTDYEQYCQDGSLYNSWSEYVESCYSYGEPCGDQCEWDPYSCCDWYCNL